MTDLRRRHPDWEWSAERNGFGGWVYRGQHSDGRRVALRAYSVLIGPSDDDCETAWFVEWVVPGDVRSQAYAAWWMAEGLAAKKESRG